MKKWICACLTLALCLSAILGVAEGKLSLGDLSNRLQKGVTSIPSSSAPSDAQEEAAAVKETEDASYGPALRIDDPFFERIRSSAYLQEDKYSREANVMIEMKNVSGRTLYPRSATVSAYDAAGTLIDEENYAYCGPDRVDNGESLFVWEWFYGLSAPISEISYFEVTVESETSTYTEYEKIEGQASVSDGIVCARIENTTDSNLYGLSATICVENAEGVLLDVTSVSTSNSCGIAPGSAMILRDNAKDYANDGYLTEGTATVYALHQLD